MIIYVHVCTGDTFNARVGAVCRHDNTDASVFQSVCGMGTNGGCRRHPGQCGSAGGGVCLGHH